MKKLSFSVNTQTCSPEQAMQEAKGLFGGQGWFLLEQAHRCLAGTLDQLPADWTERLLGCTMFNASAEMRLEPAACGGNGALVARILREGEGTEAWSRTHSYLLRKHGINAAFQTKGYDSLEHTEYFVADAASGMPVLAAERLSGFVRGQRGGMENVQ